MKVKPNKDLKQVSNFQTQLHSRKNSAILTKIPLQMVKIMIKLINFVNLEEKKE